MKNTSSKPNANQWAQFIVTYALFLLGALMLAATLLVKAARAQEIKPITVTAPTGAPQAEGTRVYIAVGNPNIKKVLLAVEPTFGSGPASEFNKTISDDMDFTDLFELLPEGRLPTKTGDLTAYKVLGVEFVLRSTMMIENGNPVAEVRLFDVNRGTQVLGRRYPLVSKSPQPGRELAHYAGNDIVESLTGQKGVFRTRLLMSCGDKHKEIYIMDFDGQNVKQLTRDGNFALSPSWAPMAIASCLPRTNQPPKAGSLIRTCTWSICLPMLDRWLVVRAD